MCIKNKKWDNGFQIKSWYLKGYYCIKCETSKKTEPLLTKLALSLILSGDTILSSEYSPIEVYLLKKQ